jgi:hypothetical protein
LPLKVSPLWCAFHCEILTMRALQALPAMVCCVAVWHFCIKYGLWKVYVRKMYRLLSFSFCVLCAVLHKLYSVFQKHFYPIPPTSL